MIYPQPVCSLPREHAPKRLLSRNRHIHFVKLNLMAPVLVTHHNLAAVLLRDEHGRLLRRQVYVLLGAAESSDESIAVVNVGV